MRPLLIDCDTGIDDGIAICLAQRSGIFDLVGITSVSGNLTADRCSANTRIILDLLEAGDIPVAKGPMRPLVRPYPRDPFSHGDNGLANIPFPPSSRPEDPRFAPDLIIETADRFPGQLEIAALGPLTNLALATIKDPGLPRKVKRVAAIAGAFGFQQYGTTRATGDNPSSEWNVYVDPEAAQLVFEAGFNLTAVGLDVATHPSLTLSPDQRARLEAANTPVARLILDVLDFVERRGFGAYCGLIDSMAIATLIDPSLVTIETIRVIVERESKLSLGQTIVERRENFAWDGLSRIDAVSDAKFAEITELIVKAATGVTSPA
jgi:purine nucleosidase/pyrimidine-specific ribonucleoside hydrolase